ncbi:unnamed protein product, partial [Gongylonema pulchrum]|uniref:Transmembrane protein n=1 Tax=Gongylonema pulchrum TaxID=637853 RepID=A0A183E858_9BILA
MDQNEEEMSVPSNNSVCDKESRPFNEEEEDAEAASKKTLSASISDEDAALETKIIRIVISVMLVITGSVNTLAAKSDFLSANVMFVGEMCCLVAYFVSLFIQRLRWRRRHRKVNDVQKPQKALVETDGRHKLEKIDEVSAEVENNDQLSLQSGASTIPTIPRFNYLLFAVPAFCDVCATSIQYFGLTLTSASAYQMLR